MIARSSTILGLALSETSIACAQLHIAGERRTIQRTATFALSAEMSLDKPDALGQALAGFLRQKRFTASRVVVGVPARWLIAVEKEVPPADEAETQATLRLQAQRLGIAETGETVFDYCGHNDLKSAAKVLLVGMLRQRLESIERAMDAAGMSLLAVTSTALTVASCAAAAGCDAGLLLLGRNSAEMVLCHQGAPRMLRHVSVSANGHETPPTAPLAAELRRVLSLAQSSTAASPAGLLLLDSTGLPPQQVSDLSQRIGIPVEPAGLGRMLGVEMTESGADSSDSSLFAPALALALAGVRPTLLQVDFAHSRLRAPAPRRLPPRVLAAIAIGAVLLIAVVWSFILVQLRSSELSGLTRQRVDMKDDVAAAQLLTERVRYAAGFFSSRPAMLECLRQITLAFRDDQRIWATGFLLHDDGKGQLSGKAADQKTVMAVYDTLRKDTRMASVGQPDMRETDGRTREVIFSMNFVFTFPEQIAPKEQK